MIDLRQFPPIMIAVPTVQWMWTDCAVSIDSLAQNLPPGSMRHNLGQGFSQIAAARNRIVDRFIALAPRHGFEWILWLDSDMIPRPDTAARLLDAATERDLSLLSATCFQRVPPYLHTLNLLPDQPPGVELTGVLEIAATGFACVLTHRRVFEAMPRPWFDGESEDTHFWIAARRAGFPCYVDCDLDCGHMATVSVDRDFALTWQDTEKGRQQLMRNGITPT